MGQPQGRGLARLARFASLARCYQTSDARLCRVTRLAWSPHTRLPGKARHHQAGLASLARHDQHAGATRQGARGGCPRDGDDPHWPGQGGRGEGRARRLGWKRWREGGAAGGLGVGEGVWGGGVGRVVGPSGGSFRVPSGLSCLLAAWRHQALEGSWKLRRCFSPPPLVSGHQPRGPRVRLGLG